MAAFFSFGFLINQIAFQGKDLQGRELVGKADDIQGVGHSVHHIESGGIHNGDAGVVALYIPVSHDDGIVAGAWQSLGDGCPVGSLVDPVVTCDIELAYTLEDPSVSRQKDIHSPAVGRQVYCPQAAGIPIIAQVIGEGKQGDAV